MSRATWRIVVGCGLGAIAVTAILWRHYATATTAALSTASNAAMGRERRIAAMRAVVSRPASDERTIEVFLNLLEDQDPVIAQEAVFFFSSERLVPERVIPGLVRRVQQDHHIEPTSRIAANALGAYGDSATKAIEPLLKAYERSRYTINKTAILEALHSIDPHHELVRATLVSASGSDDDRLRAKGRELLMSKPQ